MKTTAFIMLIIEALFACFLLYREGLLKNKYRVLIAAAAIALSFALRFFRFDCESDDYLIFLHNWVETLRGYGGYRGLKYSIGNYNIPYMYFLAVFAHLRIKDLYLIKLLSIFFDIVAAFAAMRLVDKVSGSKARSFACFLAVLLLPTVVLNGACWGQCDSIYVSLMLLGVYLALDDRPVLSMVCATLSFGFKLQAVFVLPVYAVLWVHGKIKFKHFFIFPLSYTLLMLPAILLGRPIKDAFFVYFAQAQEQTSSLSYNSPSVFALIKDAPNQALAAKLGIIAAFAFMFAVLALCLVRRKRLDGKAVVSAAMLLSAGIPFLLPYMHDRYFFAADALSLVLAFVDPMFAPAALLMQFASLIAYTAYLMGRYFIPLSYGAVAVLLVLLLAAICLCMQLFGKTQGKNKNIS